MYVYMYLHIYSKLPDISAQSCATVAVQKYQLCHSHLAIICFSSKEKIYAPVHKVSQVTQKIAPLIMFQNILT